MEKLTVLHYKLLKYGYKKEVSLQKCSQRLGIDCDAVIALLNSMENYVQPNNMDKSFTDSYLGIAEYQEHRNRIYSYIVPLVISNLITFSALIVSILKAT